MRAFSLQRKVATAIGVVLAVLLAVAILSYASMIRLAGSPDRVDRSYEVLRVLDRVTTRLTSAESGSRGYVVTGDTVHLGRFVDDTAAVGAGVATLRALLADDPAQRPLMQALEPLVARRVGMLRTAATARTEGGFEAAAELVGTRAARAASDSVRALATRIEANEVTQLQRGIAEQRLNMEYLTGAIVAAGLIVLLLGVLILVAVQQDIDARAGVAKALLEAKEAAEGASRSKSDFLARMSHELRTPLNSVIGFSNVLLKNKAGRLDEQDLSYLTRIAANGRHLLALINDVLDLSRVEAGRMPIDSVPVAVDELIADLVAEFDAQSRASDVRLLAMMPPNMAELHTDPVRLRQVLVNLIANALKFTERGSVTIRVDVDRLTREPTRIAVVDTGIGIPADRQQRIFEAFEQASSGTTRRYGGTGLGLTIARSLCEVLGYKLELSSHEGVGSVFSVVLTADAEARRAAFRRPSPPGGQRMPERLVGQVTDPARRLVLIVDDEADGRLLLSQYVEDFGCQALAVGSVQQGLAAAREFRPDLIILDLLIPTVSGWDMLRDLKAEPGIRDIPVVVVSVVGGAEGQALPGIVEALAKPVSRDGLHAALRRALGLARGRVLVIDDDPAAQRAVAAYLRDEEELDVLSAASGQEALMVLDTVRPDLIVLGLGETEGAALDFVEGLRRDRRYLHVPVVAMANSGDGTPGAARLRAEVSVVLTREELMQGGLRRVLATLGRTGREPAATSPAP